ncbi:hypothetical protein TB1_029534 [Malus domestica]
MEKLNKQKEDEEEARRAREVAFDTGFIDPGGTIAPEAQNVMLKQHEEVMELGREIRVSNKNGLEIYLNIVVQEVDETQKSRSSDVVDDNTCFCKQILNDNVMTQNSNPFEFELIIATVEEKRKLRKEHTWKQGGRRMLKGDAS